MTSLRRAVLGTLAFALAGPPVLVTVLVPLLLVWGNARDPALDARGWTWAGIVLVVAGAIVAADCMLRFALRGRGTPAPWAPTDRFVATGLYRFVRNPMYVGVLTVIAGEGLLFASPAVLVWGAALAVAFHLFVVLVEEPSLRRRFGAEYERYRAHVRRWLPRLSPYR
jgi:protein-S-isoprenylcysteine O-methyltransferase Ste14